MNKDAREKWRLATHLIDAKKAVDGILYISQHIFDLYDVRGLMRDRRSDYYINVCAVLDESVCKNKKKRSVISEHPFVDHIYHQRDKYYAHKDRTYRHNYPYASLEAEGKYLENELQQILLLCRDYLPSVITLDFVYHDARLFRQVEKISPSDERVILQKRHPNMNAEQTGVSVGEFSVLYDIYDVMDLSDAELSNYAVVVYTGLNIYEGLQNRQDMCIKVNWLFGENMWCHINQDIMRKFERLFELGVIDKFGIVQEDMFIEKSLSGELSFL